MSNLEKIKYLINEAGFTYCVISDFSGSRLLKYECKTSQDLITKITTFTKEWHGQKFTLFLKGSNSTSVENGTTVYLDLTEKVEGSNSSNQLIQGQSFENTDIDKLVASQVKNVMKEQSLTIRETTLKAKEVELDSGGSSIVYILKNHILPLFVGNTNIPNAIPNLNGADQQQQQHSNFSYSDPFINKEIEILDSPSNTNIMTDKDIKLKEAFDILSKHLDADTMLLFAKKIEANPQIVNTLKSML